MPQSKLVRRAPRASAAVPLAAVLVLLAACDLVSVAGPSEGTVGETLTFEITVAHETTPLNDARAWLMADVPAAWRVAGASYTATVGGVAVAGVPDREPPDGADGNDCFTGEPAAGDQRLFFSAGPFASLVAGDQGTLRLALDTAGDPGTFTLRFRAGSEANDVLSCWVEGAAATSDASHEVTLAAPVVAVPALGAWGVLLLAGLLAGAAARRLAG